MLVPPHPGSGITDVGHEIVRCPLARPNVVWNVLNELTTVASHDYLSSRKTFTLEDRLTNAIPVLRVDCINSVVKNDGGRLNMQCLCDIYFRTEPRSFPSQPSNLNWRDMQIHIMPQDQHNLSFEQNRSFIVT